MNYDKKGKPMFAARDTKRLIVDDENMSHKDLFGDIFPMAVVAIFMFTGICVVIIKVGEMILDKLR